MINPPRLSAVLGAALLFSGAFPAPAQQKDQTKAAAPARHPDVPYVPTTEPAVLAMLKLGEVKKEDILYDLGCGDGRIVITAAKQFGTRGVGIDIDPQRIKEANANAKKEGVEHLVRFELGDLFEAKFSEATVVTLFLLPSINLKLRPKLLEQLKPGTRVVSNTFDMGDWKAEKESTVDNEDFDSGLSSRFFLWRIPERAK